MANELFSRLEKAPAETRGYIQKVSTNMKPAGRDRSAELFGDTAAVAPQAAPTQTAGRDRSAELYGDTAAAPTQQPAKPDKKSSITDNALKGVASGFADVGDTILNAATGPVGRAIPILGPVIALADKLTGGGLQQANQERSASLDSFNQDHADSTAFGLGRLGGNIAATWPVGGLAGAAVKVAGATRLGTSIASGGFRTGAPPAATFAGRAGDAGIRTAGGAVSGGATAAAVDPQQLVGGAAVGAVAPGAVKVVGKVADGVQKVAGGAWRGAKAAVEPFTERGREAIVARTLTKAAGDDAALVAPRMAQATELVPGSAPTAGQVAESGGIAALERAMAAKMPDEFAARAVEQSGARARAVEDIAGDPGKKDFFTAARQNTAQDLYERAYSVPIEIENLTPAMRGEVAKLLQMPAVQAALKVARQNAANHGMKLDGAGNIAGLHHAKLAMDDMISELSGATGAQANKAAAIRAARDRLVTFMEKMSPDYREARGTYAAMSKPINQMDVGQTLFEKLRPALADHGAVTRENANQFANALRHVDQTVKQATGRNMRFSDVMEPQQVEALDAVARDLARKVNAQDLGRGVGSDTYQKIVLGNIAEAAGVSPRTLAAIPTALGGLAGASFGGGIGAIPGAAVGAALTPVVKGLYSGAEKQIETAIARSLLNPRTAAQTMQAELARQARLNAPRQPLLSPASREVAELLFARSSPLLVTGQ